jgi:hypothetical protein
MACKDMASYSKKSAALASSRSKFFGTPLLRRFKRALPRAEQKTTMTHQGPASTVRSLSRTFSERSRTSRALFCSTLSNRCKAIHMFGPQPSQAWWRPSSKKMQIVGAPKACCLTFRSRGRPNGMAHWPSSAGPAAHFALAVQRAMPSGSPLTQTLGIEGAGVRCSSRVSALRRELNSHDAASRECNAAAAKQRAGHPDDYTLTSTPDQRRVCLNMIEPRQMGRLTVTDRKTGNINDFAPLHQIEHPHCVVGTGFQSVRRAAAASVCTNNHSRWRRLENLAHHGQQRRAGSFCRPPAKDSKITACTNHQASTPNPSFKRTPNGVARQPSSAGASPHFELAVWRATP